MPALRILTGLMLFVASASNTGALISLPTSRPEGGGDTDLGDVGVSGCGVLHCCWDLFSLLSFEGELGAVVLRCLLSEPAGSALRRARVVWPEDRPSEMDIRPDRSREDSAGRFLSFSLALSFDDDSLDACDDERAIFSSAALRL